MKKGQRLMARLLIFVFMCFRMYHIYDANFYSRVKKDMFSLHNKDIKLVVYILVLTYNWVLPELSCFSSLLLYVIVFHKSVCWHLISSYGCKISPSHISICQRRSPASGSNFEHTQQFWLALKTTKSSFCQNFSSLTYGHSNKQHWYLSSINAHIRVATVAWRYTAKKTSSQASAVSILSPTVSLSTLKFSMGVAGQKRFQFFFQKKSYRPFWRAMTNFLLCHLDSIAIVQWWVDFLQHCQLCTDWYWVLSTLHPL